MAPADTSRARRAAGLAAAVVAAGGLSRAGLVAVAAALLLRDAWFNVLTAKHARAVEVAWPYVRSLRMEAARRQGRGQPKVRW